MSLSNAEAKLAAMQDRIAALEARIADALEANTKVNEAMRGQTQRIFDLQASLAEEARVRGLLVEALEGFGEHAQWCQAVWEPLNINCRCGLGGAIAAADALDKERG